MLRKAEELRRAEKGGVGLGGAPTQPAWARLRRLPALPEVIPGCPGRAPQKAQQRPPAMEPMRSHVPTQVLYPRPSLLSPSKGTFFSQLLIGVHRWTKKLLTGIRGMDVDKGKSSYQC